MIGGEEDEPRVGVVGLGYVGLPLAMAFGRERETVGFDISKARVQALLKRSARPASERFQAGPFEIDPGRSTATCDAEEIALTGREVRILRLLAAEPGRIVSRRALLRDGWDMNNADQVETRTVDVHIAKLRKKLGKHGESLVETIRGQGYRLWTRP